MDILYTLGRGSQWQDNELRYSLRSLAKYGRNIGRIFIVGDWCPSFVNRSKVTWIKCDIPYKDKGKNILHQIMYACEHSEIAEDFLWSSDDHFYVKETDFDNYPHYLKADDLPTAGCLVGYQRILWETRCLLEENRYPTKNFAQHCNTHFKKSVFLKHKSLLEKAYIRFCGTEQACMMNNILLKEQPFAPVYREDIKIKDCRIKDIRSLIGEQECFSIGDKAIPVVEPFLKEEFSTPCEYEKELSCVIAVPIYKKTLYAVEEVSIDRCFEILKSWPIVFFAPETLDTSYYEKRYPSGKIERFPDHFFRSINDYSHLLETAEFYERFSNYLYMQIYQPDCWIFTDNLRHFLELGYDWIAPPLLYNKQYGTPRDTIGCGGFSLRSIPKFLAICKETPGDGTRPEDVFFSIDHVETLKVSPLKIAIQYAFAAWPDNWYRINKGLPMGCHNPWHKETFWEKYGVPCIL